MASNDVRKTGTRGRNAATRKDAGTGDAAANVANPDQKAPGKGRRAGVKAKVKTKAEAAARPAAKTGAGTGARSATKTGAKPAGRSARAAAKPATTRRKAAAAPKPAAPVPVADKSDNRRDDKHDGKPDPAQALATAVAGLARQAASPPPGSGSSSGVGRAAASRIAENMERIEALTQRLAAALSQRPVHDPGVEGPGADLVVNAGMAWAKLWAEQPARILEQQVRYWGATLAHFAEIQSQLAKGKLTAPPDDEPETDKRFRNPMWRTHPYFNLVRTQYQINADSMREAAAGLDMASDVDQQRLNWLTNQIIDMFAPTNFFATNPDAIERALETEGESLVKGLENLVRDIESNGGELVVSLADRNAFAVGENIGTAPGRVVRREHLYELIQFSPTTEQVHAVPIVLFPPWINKFYILDLKPENSLIRWIVDQGYTLFVVSWKNPDVSYADTGLEDYVSAYLTVMDAVKEITGQPKLNAVGYCIGGTTLSLTLALLAQRGDDRVESATFFTTLTDFSEQGEFTPFLQADFVEGITAEVARAGIFASHLMTRTMSFLRANDLVWGPAIRSYLMGETPPAFDLLFWNGDATNLPGRMTIDYLRGLCQQNLLVNDGFPLLGHKVSLKDINLPLCAVGCETDHIAPWKYSWLGVRQMPSEDKRFILSESGHISGIVNPPSKKKYGHYTTEGGFDAGPDEWRETAQFTPGSWWPTWEKWLAIRSGDMVPAREPDEGFGPAPGTYVHERH